MAKKNNRKLQLKGKVAWFMPTKPSSYSKPDAPKYEIKLTNLEDFPENAEVLKTFDIKNTKTRKEGTGNDTRGKNTESGRFVTSTSKFPIKVADTQRQPWPEGTGIGNGTEVIAVFEEYPSASDDWDFGLGIRMVYVTKLVEYVRKETKDDIHQAVFGDGDTYTLPAAPEGDLSGEATPSGPVDLDDEIPF